MKKKWIISLLAALVVIAGVVTAVVLLAGGGEKNAPIAPGDTAMRTDGNWHLTGEWTIERADSGEETLRVLAAEDSTAWNTFFNLYEDWSVSADMTLTQTHGASDCMRVVFGDDNDNVCLVFSAEYQGRTRVLLRADALTENGWKNILLGEEWIDIEEAPVTLMVRREDGKNTLDVELSQEGERLSVATTKSISDKVMNMVCRPGLGVYHTEGAFSSFAVVAARKPTDASENTEGVIIAGENVPTDEWLLGENAVHNLIDGKSAIILDGEGENSAWNAVNTLGDVWTLSFKVEFGKSYRDSVCARVMFGAETDAEYTGLITINYANGTVSFAAQNKESGSWVTTAGSMGWRAISGRSIRVELVKYAGINRLAAFLYDGERLVYSTFTDEMSGSDMARYAHYGVMVYSSQVRFSEFRCEEKADESKMPPMTERVYPRISELTIGEAEPTDNWSLSKNTIFFRENGKEAMVIDSKGEEFSYYQKNSIDGAWSASAKVEFGLYYAETAGIRIGFRNANGDLSALLTVKYSPNENTFDVNMQTYDKKGDVWTDLIKSGWTKGESSFVLSMSATADGKLSIRLLGATSGRVLYEKTVAGPENLAVIGLGTLNAQSKYSEIEMNLTGKGIAVKPSTDPSEKTMYALKVGTPASSSVWTGGDGVTYNTEGALIIQSAGNQYAYNQDVSIQDAFSISTDILFGSFDSSGCCTARIALVDQYRGMIGLFSVKFSENFEIMVEGQYNNNGVWVNCISDNAWREVQDNRVRITLSRTSVEGGYVLSISDFSGRNVFYGSYTFPNSVSRKITTFGVGVDKATVKFSNIRATVSGGSGGVKPDDYGMLPITTGTAGTTEEWSAGEGITYYTDESLVLTVEQGDLYSYHRSTKITDGFSVSTDVHYGSLDENGVSSARLVLTDTDNSKLALFTVKFSKDFEIMVEGEYNTGSGWNKCVSDNAWRAAKDNRASITLTRADGSNDCVLTVKDSTGAVIFTESCAMPQMIAARIAGFGIGVDKATVKFSNLAITATQGEPKPEKVLVAITESGEKTAESADWTGGEGVQHYSDGSVILTAAESDVYVYSRSSPLAQSFSLSATVQFGALDTEGVSTARFALTDAENRLVGLFTLKFSEHFEVMLEGQYRKDDTWTSVLTDNTWRPVPDNFVTLTLSRVEGSASYGLLLRDSLGNLLCQLSTSAFPEEVNAAIAGLGLGCRGTQVKLTSLSLTTEGGGTADEEPILPGTPTVPTDWSGGAGVTHYTDGSIIVAGSGDCFTYYTAATMRGTYEIKSDILFGTRAADNTATARLTLASSGRDPIGLFSVKYSDGKQVLLEGQYFSGGTWTSAVYSDWIDLGTNRVVLTLRRAAEENKWTILLTKPDGTALYSMTTAEIPQSVIDEAIVCGLGSYSSQVQFKNIAVSTEGGNLPVDEEEIVPGTPAATADWHLDAGATYYADGSIITDGAGDAYAFFTASQTGAAYTLRTDVLFGTKGDNGTATARIAVGDAAHHPVALFTLKCDAEDKLLVEGQYYDGVSWTTIAGSGWVEAGTKRVCVTLRKEAGEDRWSLAITKTDGTALFSVTTAEIPAAVLSNAIYLGVGSYRSQVQFKNIVTTVSGVEE